MHIEKLAVVEANIQKSWNCMYKVQSGEMEATGEAAFPQ